MGAQQRKYILLQKFQIRILKNSLMSRRVAAGGVSERVSIILASIIVLHRRALLSWSNHKSVSHHLFRSTMASFDSIADAMNI
jgi:hypothetical protein